MGESAGGGLAAMLALIARDRGGPRIAFQHLLYPMLDDRTVTRADQNPVTGEFIWTRTHNRHGWTGWLGQEPGSEDVSYHAAPARVPDPAGLPPTWIGTGSLDLFLDEDIAYAQRLIRAGVAVDLVVWPGAYHAFDMSPEGDVAARANADRQAALARAFGRA
jgi:acetyl esterase/lipase